MKWNTNKIIKIQINNFRTLLKTEINIDKNKINFFLGANESGKSNILNAISLIDMEKGYQFQTDYKTTLSSGRKIGGNFSIILEDEKLKNTINEQLVQQFNNNEQILLTICYYVEPILKATKKDKQHIQ